MNTLRLYSNNNKSDVKIKKNRLTLRKHIEPVVAFTKQLTLLYPKCIHDNCKFNEKYKDHVITYGEMQYDGIDKLYNNIMSLETNDLTQPPKYIFLDIGAGRGKIPFYLASKPNILQCFGIELVEERYADSINILKKLSKRKIFRPFISKIKIFNENMFNMNYRDLLSNTGEGSQPKCFIWISNLCFDSSTTDKLFAKLSEELEPNSIICCSKKPSMNELSFSNHFEFINQISIPMSWTTSSNVYLIRKI